MTAQEAFAVIVRDHLAPALRADGFTGSGANFTLPNADHWVLLGFQKSRHSDSGEVQFTINLTVVSKATWAAERASLPHLPERPAPNTRYGTFAWHRRIGLLMPLRRDHWWTVTATTELANLAAEVVRAVHVSGLPAIRAQLQLK